MTSDKFHVRLPELFHDRLFVIPAYQRGYAWGERELEDFWGDLELLSARESHFFGMVVVKERDEVYDKDQLTHFEAVEVIDGQQRLTTLTLLLHGITRLFQEAGHDERAAKVTHAFLQTGRHTRLTLNDASRKWLQTLLVHGSVVGTPDNGSEANLAFADRFLDARLRALGDTPQARAEAAEALLRKVTSQLRFVFYAVQDDDEAGLIFEVMNNRGKPLSQADRLKNYLMYVLEKLRPPEERGRNQIDPDLQRMGDLWGDVFRQIMRAVPDGRATEQHEDRLLANHWILYYEHDRPKAFRSLTLSQRIRELLPLAPPAGQAPEDWRPSLRGYVVTYAESLAATAHDYAEIMNPDAPGALQWVPEALRDRTRHVLLSFERVGYSATALPLLLAGRRRLARQPERFLKLAEDLLTFVVRAFGIVGRRSHTGRNRFRWLAHRLFQAKDEDLEATSLQVIDEVRGFTEAYGNDAQTAEALRHPEFYRKHSNRQTRFLFFELEMHRCAARKSEPNLDWAGFRDGKTTQVEHIWPFSREWLGGSEASHGANVHRLGNLTITRFNPELAARSFAEKKPIYATSSLVVENELQHERQWSLAGIDRREAELVPWVLGRWPVRAKRTP